MIAPLLFAVTASCSHPASEYDAIAELYLAAHQKVLAALESEGLVMLRALSESKPWLPLIYREIGEVEYARRAWLPAFVAYKRYLVASLPLARDRPNTRLRLAELESRIPALRAFADAEQEALAGHWDRAIERLRFALWEKPSFALAHRLMGIAYASEHRREEALDAYARYVALDPKAPDADTVRAYLARRADPQARAPSRPTAAQVLAPSPARPAGCIEAMTVSGALLHDATLRYAAAVSQGRQGNDKNRADAARAFDRLARDYPWFAPAYRGIGVVTSMRQYWVPAYIAFKRYLLFDVYSVDQNRVENELTWLEAKEPALALYAQGEAFFARGDWANARSKLEAALMRNSTLSLAYERLGPVYEALGMKEEATKAYTTSLGFEEASPTRETIAARLAVLRAHP